MPLFGSAPDVEKLKARGDVKGLIKALEYKKDDSIRRSSAEALGELIKAKKGIGPDEIVAVGKLGPMGVYALECLARGVGSQKNRYGDPDANEPPVIQIVGILHSIGTEEAIRVLVSIASIPELFSSSRDISIVVAKALLDLDKNEAIKAFISIVCNRRVNFDVVAAEAVKILSQFNDESATNAIISACGDFRENVRRAAAEALLQPRNNQLLDLKGMIDSILEGNSERAANLTDQRIVAAMVRALQTADVASGAYDDKRILWAKRAGTALRLMGDKTMVKVYISALLDPKEPVRREAAMLLGYIGDKDATEPLLAYIDRKDTLLWEGFDALGDIGDERAIPKLKELALRIFSFRKAATKALLHLGEAGIVAVSDMIESQDMETFADMLKQLAQLGSLLNNEVPTQFLDVLRIKYEQYPELKRRLYHQAVKDEVHGSDSILQLSLVRDFSLLSSLMVRRDELRDGISRADTSHGGPTGSQIYGDFLRAVDFMERRSQG